MTDEDVRLNAALAGRYRIERKLGQGGMATVYLARDLRHDRRVAVKVLQPELAAVIGADRFLAEIRTTANLQHPHILPLHDSGEAESLLYYVMPYVEGESLRERLDREHELPVAEAVRIATTLAEALEYAHSQGVIHRDIKPGNVLLQHGKPVLSDFGIARAVSSGGGTRLTETGLSLGTPHYMSPEQAAGDPQVGPASDVFSLGCVLHEMLVGEPPFTGKTPQAVLGRLVLGRVEPVSARRRSVPPHVEAVVARALEKVPADRFASAGDMARALADPGFRHGASGAGRQEWSRGRWAAAGAALVVGALGGWLARDGGVPVEATVSRSIHALPDSMTLGATSVGSIAVSPDGVRVAYFAGRRLWVKEVDRFESRAVEGAPAGAAPFFSPDGRWIAFVSGRQLRKIPTSGGSPEPLAPVGPWFYGGSWEDDRLYFATSDAVMRVHEDGGDAEIVVDVEAPAAPYGPRLIPGTDILLYTLAEGYDSNRWNEARIIARPLESGEEVVIGRGSDARYLPTGHLLYALGSALYVVPFDVEALEQTGVPVVVADPVQRATNPIYWGGTANYGVSSNGTLAYIPAVTSTGGTFVVSDREGNRQPLGELTQLRVARIRVSPDGERLAFVTIDPGDVWVYEMANGRLRRITHDGGNRWHEWIDDDLIAYTSPRAGADNLFVQRWDRADPPQQLTFSDFPVHLSASSGDGLHLAYHAHPTGSRITRVVVTLEAPSDGRGEITDEVELPIPGDVNSFSPDGEWVAYSSGGNVYITRSDGTGTLVPVTTDGGRWGLWRAPNELFFKGAGPRQVLSASVQLEPDIRVGVPGVLFEGPFQEGPGAVNFEVLEGGSRFVLVVPGEDASTIGTRRDRIHVTVNWFGELEGLGSR